MALNKRDAESSFLYAKATVEEWQGEFIRTWLQPEIDLALIQFWGGMDPVMKQYLKSAQPQAFRRVEDQVKAAKERYTHGATG